MRKRKPCGGVFNIWKPQFQPMQNRLSILKVFIILRQIRLAKKDSHKTGVAKLNDVVVPNPVTLAPYRTFPEIEQPKSKFIFRMQSGPTATLFEADGGAWRNEAMKNIKVWLKTALSGVDNIRIIS